ncbi:MAG: LolA family protein [Blastocatellia bacterium]
MRKRLFPIIFMLTLVCPLAFAQAPKSVTQPAKTTTSPDIAEVIRRFAAAESENKTARNNYTFTQDFDLQSLGAADSITGRFKRVSDIVYDDLGNRVEKITYFPASTLTVMNITQQDMQDLAGVQPFALTTEDLPKYEISYVGKEKIDELNTYVFNVKPKQMVKNERYFQGRIWVDDQDLQIVKVAGQGVPEDENNKYPHFESYRENIDGRYWFPTYVYADDTLEFKRDSVHMRMTVRFTNYKRFGGKIRVLDDGEVSHDDDPPSSKPTKPAAPTQAKPPAQSTEPSPKLKRPGDRP